MIPEKHLHTYQQYASDLGSDPDPRAKDNFIKIMERNFQTDIEKRDLMQSEVESGLISSEDAARMKDEMDQAEEFNHGLYEYLTSQAKPTGHSSTSSSKPTSTRTALGKSGIFKGFKTVPSTGSRPMSPEEKARFDRNVAKNQAKKELLKEIRDQWESEHEQQLQKELERLDDAKLSADDNADLSGDVFSELGSPINSTVYERDVTFVERVLKTGENIVKGTGSFDQAAVRTGQINYTQTVTEKGTDTVQRPGFQTGKVETRVQVVPEKFQYGEVEHVFLPKSVPTDVVNPLFSTPTTADGAFSPSGEPVLGETIPDSTIKTAVGGKGYYNYQTGQLSTQASATLSPAEFNDAVT
eukprot:tig00021221_g19345.t1